MFLNEIKEAEGGREGKGRSNREKEQGRGSTSGGGGREKEKGRVFFPFREAIQDDANCPPPTLNIS